MVDELEMNIIDADERRDIPVTVSFIGVLGKWYIGHAKSGQAAFRSSVNGFGTKEEAIEFAEKHDCEVVS